MAAALHRKAVRGSEAARGADRTVSPPWKVLREPLPNGPGLGVVDRVRWPHAPGWRSPYCADPPSASHACTAAATSTASCACARRSACAPSPLARFGRGRERFLYAP
jgi:hypothetical protein